MNISDKINVKAVKSAATAIVILGLIALVMYIFSLSFLGKEKVETFVEAAGVFGVFVIVVVKASTLVIAPIGGSFLYPLVGVLYGTKVGFWLTLLGDLSGTVVSYWVARRLGRKAIKKIAGEKSIKSIDSFYIRIGEWKGLILARFVLPDIVNYAAGLIKIKFWKYLAIVLITQIPMDLFLVNLAVLPSSSWQAKVFYILVGSGYAVFFGYYWYKLFGRKSNDTKDVMKSG